MFNGENLTKIDDITITFAFKIVINLFKSILLSKRQNYVISCSQTTCNQMFAECKEAKYLQHVI